MPRKSKKNAESPAGLSTEEYAKPGEPILEAPDYKLAKYEPPERPAAQIKTARSFTGRIASGRGRTITADDSSFAIESDKPLTAGEITLAQRNGFDDFSEKSDGRIMVADKGEMRACNGDINHVARALTSRGTGWDR